MNMVRDRLIEHVGEQLKVARARHGLTQTELAELAGLSFLPVLKLEDGKSVTLASLASMCVALGLEIRLVPRGSGA